MLPGAGSGTDVQAGVNGDIIPEVQGLRGLTALAVILFHMGWLWCGWLGVWVFFTLSGFVITRSMVRAEAAGQPVSPGRFYRARIARILPLYLAAITVGVATLCLEAWLFDRPESLAFLTQVPWLMTGTFNVFRVIPGYEETRMFGHLWSLSVEEQYYLLFPLLFAGLRRAQLVVLFALLVILGPFWRLGTHMVFSALGWSVPDVATAIYQLTFNHLDAFALGGLIAINEGRLRALTGSRLARRLTWAIPVGLATLAAVCVILQNAQVSTSGKDVFTDAFQVKPQLLSGQILVYALGVLGAGGLLVLILTGSRIVALLGADSLIRLGTISFGLYVWHFPLLWIFADAGHRTLVSAGLYLGVTLVAAILSYRYLEQPARRWLEPRRRMSEVSPAQSPTSVVQSPARP
ncbi:hypothetical protein IP78_00255 [Brevundimonas sp. AAP58]|uniref:acyltransferase family protein n=1 Tax=Brevundimonas sp. AAP58 TaxID=1523422 RepID=UPI0006B88479|nr:acyltransferase [Brevundimonas sp. AAP58]KPF84984.1 hypothetical protein IP78_00255 [Brevundimonas sp. AAP58]